MLFLASLMKRIVAAVAALLVLSIVSVLEPFIVTLSAPFRSIKLPAIAPDMDRVPLGLMVRVDHEPPEG